MLEFEDRFHPAITRGGFSILFVLIGLNLGAFVCTSRENPEEQTNDECLCKRVSHRYPPLFEEPLGQCVKIGLSKLRHADALFFVAGGMRVCPMVFSVTRCRHR